MTRNLWPRIMLLMGLTIIVILSSWIVSLRNHNLEIQEASEIALKDEQVLFEEKIRILENTNLSQNEIITSQKTQIESLENDIEIKYAWQESYLGRLESQLEITSKYLEQQSAFFEPLVDSQNILKLKVLDVYTYELKTHLYLEPTGNMFEDAKLIGETLSEYVFEGLKIDVKEWQVDDLKLLKIDLSEINQRNEKGYYDDASWANGYFQGSTGGLVTYMTLTSSFLQPELSQWYDGVYFLYEGQEETFEHVEGLIGQIILRE